MGAQHVDRLQFFGITLTGGDAAPTSLALLLGAKSGYGPVASQVNAQFTFAAAKNQNGTKKKLYYDTFLSNIIYATEKNADGGIDLLIYNALTPLINLAYGSADNIFTQKYDPVTGEDIPNPLRNTGVQRVKNFEMANSTTQGSYGVSSGFNAENLAGYGDLNLVFRDRNPLAVIALLQPFVRGIPIVQSLFAAYNALALADAALWVGAAALAAGNDNEMGAWREATFRIDRRCA
jgi:hypothetical protein